MRKLLRSALAAVLRWLRLLTTSRDGQTPDFIRIGAILIGAQFLGLAAWDMLMLHNRFDAMAYGGGAAAILGAAGAALGFKRKDEPSA